ncbi:MAG TPA: hypothetical protein EYG74_00915 [Sulfurimonas autotrophica]|nr:hypothetical protein [Sulfurimonas autotrophica]
MGILSHGKVITVLQYFTDKIDDYWHILYPVVSKDKRDDDSYLYVLDISRKALDYKGQFTSNGIYLFKGYDGHNHIYALEISVYALASWLAWRKTKDDIWLDKALLHCDWLVQNQYPDGSWRMEHKNKKYNDLSIPWPSALAQGLGISSLLRAYVFTKKVIYLDCAKQACNFLEVDIEQNGVKRVFEKGGLKSFIYEEYPRKELSGVLNGYISAIFGIQELASYDLKYQKLFEKNMENLKKIMPLYDMGYWTYYSLDDTVASGFYHRLVVKQLEILVDMDTEFTSSYTLFLSYQNDVFKRLKALQNKIRTYA